MKIYNKLKSVLVAGLITSSVFLPSASVMAASFNYDAQDPPTLQISNYSHNPGSNANWSGSVSADAGEIVSFKIYYHNTGDDTASNTTIRVNLPYGSFTSQTISGQVSASNSNSSSGSVSLYLSSNQSLTFIPGSLRWYPNQSGQSQNAPFGQSGAEIISSGLNIGNIINGWSSQGYAVFQAQVGSNNVPVQDTVPQNNYYYPSYTPSYTPTYVPVYYPSYAQPQPIQQVSTPAPLPVVQIKPAQITAKTNIFQRSEDKLEFEIYLGKEKALVGDENILFARYYNAGGSAAQNATLYLTLPDGVEFLKFTATPAVMREGNLFEYNIGTVSAGEEKVVTLNFLVSDRAVPGTNLIFNGKLEYTGSKGTAKSIMDSTSLEITTANELTASVFSIFGPILNSWVRQLLIGILIGFFICWFFFRTKKEPLTFKQK